MQSLFRSEDTSDFKRNSLDFEVYNFWMDRRYEGISSKQQATLDMIRNTLETFNFGKGRK